MTGQRVDARCAAQALVDDHLIWVRGPIRAPASTIVATSSRRIIDSNYCLSPQAPAFNHGLLAAIPLIESRTDLLGVGRASRRPCTAARQFSHRSEKSISFRLPGS
jgi:hypothetical protein